MRGGDQSIGLPIADPISTGAKQTWLFQRFAQPPDNSLSDQERPLILPSTMEIRGSPPVLWMERQAGNWMSSAPGIGSALDFSDFDKSRTKGGATLWESFKCNDTQGPCTVEPEEPFPPPNLENAGIDFCDGNTYFPGLSPPPEWRSGPAGDYAALPVFGCITSAHMSGIDNGLTHETHNSNCPYLGWGLAIGAVVDWPNVYGEYVSWEEYGATCESDFEFFLRPIGPITKPSMVSSLFGKDNKIDIKIEYEVAYAAAVHNFLGAPAVGDLVHVTGRWIIDCGHESFKSELHPLFSFARMKSVISETNPATGLEDDLFNKKPATRVAIWISGWYPGGDNNAIEFDAFPPPRPSADAVLHVVKPVDSDAAQDVNVEFNLTPVDAAKSCSFTFHLTFAPESSH